MKRTTIRPGKNVAVSSAALARAQNALQAFGLTTADLDRLADFDGDVTCGPVSALRPNAKPVVHLVRGRRLAPAVKGRPVPGVAFKRAVKGA